MNKREQREQSPSALSTACSTLSPPKRKKQNLKAVQAALYFIRRLSPGIILEAHNADPQETTTTLIHWPQPWTNSGRC